MKTIHKQILLILSFLIVGCEGFLDEKPSKSIVTITSLDAMQALLDNTVQAMNSETNFRNLRTDEFAADQALLVSSLAIDRAVYLWEAEPYAQDDIVNDWSRQYIQVFNANVVLDEIERINLESAPDLARKNTITGTAYFFRALAYFNLAQVFAEPFDPNGDNSSLCFPLRTLPDPNVRFERATVGEVYELILSDLEKSLGLLPQSSSIATRPTRNAARSLMARIYLAMEMYDLAHENAEMVLQTQNNLLNFNELEVTVANPFTRFNIETIFYSDFYFSGFTFSQLFKVSDDFIALYKDGDLRKSAFFSGSPEDGFNMTGHYTGSIEYFSGITTAEMLLVVAEVAARNSDFTKARELLLKLVENRYAESMSPSLSEIQDDELLKVALEERKKELIGRGVRWSDLRRLNRDPRFAVTIRKSYEESNILIPPNDERYTSVIPPREREIEGF